MQTILLAKTGGARMKHVNTYKVVCDNPAKNIFIKGSMTTGEEVGERVSDFVHVAKAALLQKHGKECVVKVHHARNYFVTNELQLLQHLKDCTNVVQYICHFTWWMKQLNMSNERTPCLENGKDALTFIVMEYIHDGDLEAFLRQQRPTKETMAFFKLVALVIMELGDVYKVYHGDLNSGNILMKKTTKQYKTFKIDGKTYRAETNGYVPVLVDFGRGGTYCATAKNRKQIISDVFLAWSVMVMWLADEDASLRRRMEEMVSVECQRKRLRYSEVLALLDKIT